MLPHDQPDASEPDKSEPVGDGELAAESGPDFESPALDDDSLSDPPDLIGIALPADPIVHELTVTDQEAGQRFDSFLAAKFPSHSRVQLRRAINEVQARVNGSRAKAAHRLHVGERVTCILPVLVRPGPVPENIPLDVLYEDEFLAAINKPPGMVVHPGKGHWQGTLTSALAYHFEHLSSVGGPTRPGIVHRLDRDTSGVIVIAKTDRAHSGLAKQFEDRTTEKEYFALVSGVPNRDRDVVNQPIGLHPHQREKMAIRRDHASCRDATTFIEVLERFDRYAAVRCLPKTGRTHQIRVHLAYLGCPVLCDKLYGGRSHITRGEIVHRREDGDILLTRSALHARRLKLLHPITGVPLLFEASIPADIAGVLAVMKAGYRP